MPRDIWGHRYTISDEEIYNYLLKEDRPVTRPEIVEKFDLPRSTVYDMLVRLEGRGLIERHRFHRHEKGRPRIGFAGVIRC